MKKSKINNFKNYHKNKEVDDNISYLTNEYVNYGALKVEEQVKIREDIQNIRDFIIESNSQAYTFDRNKYQTAITKCNRVEQWLINSFK